MRVVPVGRDLWVRNHNGLQVKSPVSQVSAGTQSESFQGKGEINTCIFNFLHCFFSGHPPAATGCFTNRDWLQPGCEEHRIYTRNTSMLELTGHFINYLLLASQRKWPVGVFLLWYFQSFFFKCTILKRERKRVHVLGSTRLEAGGGWRGAGRVWRVSQSFLSGIVTRGDWHITFYKEHRPFQLTWGLMSGLFFFF